MRISVLGVAFVAVFISGASCLHSPMVNTMELSPTPAAADDEPMGFIEMDPLYVDAREQVAKKIKAASKTATELCARQLGCPAVRVVRADLYRRADGTPWTVIRLNACGEERVYEQTPQGWSDATSRLR